MPQMFPMPMLILVLVVFIFGLVSMIHFFWASKFVLSTEEISHKRVDHSYSETW